MQRGEKIDTFFPNGQILSEWVSSRDGDQRGCCLLVPHPQDYPPVHKFHLCVIRAPPASRQHYTGTSSWRREASSLTSGPSVHFPAGAWALPETSATRPRCRHQGHTPQGKGFPALPTKAGWTVAGGWKEKGGGGGWQFPLACCCPCWVGGGWGPPGPGVCP